jgi:hypothetical protein
MATEREEEGRCGGLMGTKRGRGIKRGWRRRCVFSCELLFSLIAINFSSRRNGEDGILVDR